MAVAALLCLIAAGLLSTAADHAASGSSPVVLAMILLIELGVLAALACVLFVGLALGNGTAWLWRRWRRQAAGGGDGGRDQGLDSCPSLVPFAEVGKPCNPLVVLEGLPCTWRRFLPAGAREREG
jgi:hypothetical protein